MLIWLYSESENVKQQKPLQFTVEFAPPPGQKLIITPSERQRVLITVSCATSQYAELQRLQATPLELGVSEDLNSPQQIVILQDKINDSPVGDLGVSFVDIQPRTLDLRVERVVEVTMPISVDSVVPDGVQLAAAPTLAPTEGTVDLPASVIENLGELSLEVRLNPEEVARLEENVPHELTVPISLPKPLADAVRPFDASITPSNASVTLTIRKQTDTHKIAGVPILMTAPWAEMKRFTIELENDQRVLSENVEISGPSDVIDKIRKGEVGVWAELRLTVDDLESGISSKQLRINVPTGVRVESTIPHVAFKITQTVIPTPLAAP